MLDEQFGSLEVDSSTYLRIVHYLGAVLITADFLVRNTLVGAHHSGESTKVRTR